MGISAIGIQTNNLIIDIDKIKENLQLALKLNVKSIPMTFVYVNGEKRVVKGSFELSELQDLIQNSP